MTTTIQGVKQNPDLLKDDLRLMALTINQLVKDANRRSSELTKKSITTSTTLDDNYTVILVDATSAAVTVTLPAAASYAGRFYYIKKIDSSTNAVTIDGNGSETIDGSLTAVISIQYTCMTIYSDGTEWWIIMTFIPETDYNLEVSRGQITGRIGVFQFGRNTDVDAAEDIWAGGGDFTPPTTARTHNIASSDANDTSAGTGARTVKIYGLNSSYALASETVTMNGTSNVATASTYTFIYKMEVLTAGSGGVNAGNITATAQTDATVSAYMPIGYNVSSMAIYMVPAGYTAYINSFKAGMSNATASQYADVGLYVKPFGGAYNLKALHSLVNSGSSVEENIFRYPISATEKSIIKMRCSAVQSANTDIQGEIDLILVAN